ncbi:MAG: hypothetical protein NZO16_06360 [Deltaproteobacteria bacterium]|nr:hypothetical protein [Deltaproteobacteria bacterium]
MKKLVALHRENVSIQENLDKLIRFYAQLFWQYASQPSDYLEDWQNAYLVGHDDKMVANVRQIKSPELDRMLIDLVLNSDNSWGYKIPAIRALPCVTGDVKDLLKKIAEDRDLSSHIILVCLERLTREGEIDFVFSCFKKFPWLVPSWLSSLKMFHYQVNRVPLNRWSELSEGHISFDENPECFICSRLISLSLDVQNVQQFFLNIMVNDKFSHSEKTLIAYFMWKQNITLKCDSDTIFDQIISNQELTIPYELIIPGFNVPLTRDWRNDKPITPIYPIEDFSYYACLFFPFKFFLAHVVQLDDQTGYSRLISYIQENIQENQENKERFRDNRRTSVIRTLHLADIRRGSPASAYFKDLSCILPAIIALKQSSSTDAINCLLELVSDKSLDLFLRQAAIYALQGRNLGELEGEVHSVLQNIALDQEEEIELRWQAILALKGTREFDAGFYVQLLNATNAKYGDSSSFAEASAFRPLSKIIIECLRDNTDPQISDFLLEALSEGKLLQTWGWQSAYVIPLMCQSQNPNLVKKLCQAVFEEFRKSNSHFQRPQLLGVLAKVSERLKDADIEEFIVNLIEPSESDTHKVIQDPLELSIAFEILGYVAPHRIPDLLHVIENLSTTDFRLFLAYLQSAPKSSELLQFFEHLVARHFVETEDVSALEFYSDILIEHQSLETTEILLSFALSEPTTYKSIMAARSLSRFVAKAVAG